MLLYKWHCSSGGSWTYVLDHHVWSWRLCMPTVRILHQEKFSEFASPHCMLHISWQFLVESPLRLAFRMSSSFTSCRWKLIMKASDPSFSIGFGASIQWAWSRSGGSGSLRLLAGVSAMNFRGWGPSRFSSTLTNVLRRDLHSRSVHFTQYQL